MAYIGIVIALGVIIGEFLEATGGAEKIAQSVLRLVGRERRALSELRNGPRSRDFTWAP